MDFLYLLTVYTTNVLAQNSAPANVVEAIPPWLKLAGAIVALITAIIGVPAAYWVSKKARLETIKLQLEILKAEGRPRQSDNSGAPQTPLSREDVIASPHAVLTGIQGFIIRFIILYVAMLAWGIVARLLNPLITAHLAYFIQAHQAITEKWYWVLIIAFYSQLAVLGDILIFLLLGWSLLSDIARFVGVRPFRLFRQP